jgi:RNA polymerase sigma-70 factor (ECF subfamily)
VSKSSGGESTRSVVASVGSPGIPKVVPVTWPSEAAGADNVTAARAGDHVAFAALYRDMQPRLLRYATGLVGQDAEDVTAEAWLQIARDITRFSGGDDDFRGWATTIVRNRAMDFLRARARRPMFAATATGVPDHPAADAATMASEHMSTADAVALISTLPRDQAEAVLLRAVVGLDAVSAGRVLGKRPGAVRVAAHRGLKTLARRLEQAAAEQADNPGGGTDG